ncbi:4-hydroxythreonine-4-phosphate dehydrogenase PdxA [Clostridium massiliodielmoense]|uniref:4-hydroxythreonine-4-phosphate dehydrogenase PdxA n=1 Tax=Clostridium massiliodielmoense TaxID=1776385 RepID=UPI000A93D10C|nr:4-hydroxythreonine-4-phosphate dehydrogenase PdxA [Clostridium massiliodielmoense]
MDSIGITMGDPAGIGAEIILKALDKYDKYRKKSIIFGSKDVMEFYRDILNVNAHINIIEDINEFNDSCINLVNCVDISMDDIKIGQVSGRCGDAAYKYVEESIKWALNKKIKAVVTTPLNKKALHLGNHNFDGHTEIFAKLTGTKKYAMLLWSDDLKVIHVSTHISLFNACKNVKKERIFDVINLANDTLKKMGVKNPRIAVAGLNPHAGEDGIFGTEEINEIGPAVEEARKRGINVHGPIPPDIVFLKAYNKEYDIVVAMYHDQGHIPMKLLEFDSGVNITVGLPIIRTSVDHGTAFDIAGNLVANDKSLIQAIKVACIYGD